MHLRSGNKSLDLSARVVVTGVINATPDSYHAPSRASSVEDIAKRAVQLLAEGADIVEIGGESTGPGSADVSLVEELERVLPAVKAVRLALPHAWIAVDTWKAEVARQALAAGADLINDITAGRADPRMFRVIADAHVPCVLMFSKDAGPRTTVADIRYGDVVSDVKKFFIERIAAAKAAGIKDSSLIVDPGLGHFVSSDPAHSFELLRRLGDFTDLGPVMVSPSRKSFLAGPLKLPASDRLPATLAATVLAVQSGARLIRTHDVRATHDALVALEKGIVTPPPFPFR